ncbi:hypothetical protein [Nocardia sp. NPDC051981]|uniref:hypothetical protein n=1 Tax=Nocardia sp. NPDC051981 TaxID=3155417 RepID=UPI00341B9A47
MTLQHISQTLPALTMPFLLVLIAAIATARRHDRERAARALHPSRFGATHAGPDTGSRR